MVHADGTVRTNEMALVAVLRMHGYMPIIDRSRDRKTAMWHVPTEEVDEDTESLVDEYVRGAVRVEPKRFMHEMKLVRHEMYAFLGSDGPRRPSAI